MIFIVNTEKSSDHKAMQYMQAIPGITMRIIDLATDSISESEIMSISKKLSMPIEDMLDSDYDDHISVHTEGLRMMDRQSLLTLMSEDKKIIATPIVITDTDAFILGKGEENMHSGMAFEIASRIVNAGNDGPRA